MTQDQHAEARQRLIAEIAAEGAGAGIRWHNIATAALGSDQKAMQMCADRLGAPLQNAGDITVILDAAFANMTDGEINQQYNHGRQLLAARTIDKDVSDAYLGNRLGDLRQSRGMTQAALAAKAGLALVVVQKLENGTRGILRTQTVNALRLAGALGVTVEELVSNSQIP